MGFYAEHLLPRLVDWGMGREQFRVLRPRVLEGVYGRVLEVGFGSGLNLPFYPADVDRVLALEPSELMRRLAHERIESSPVPVEMVGLRGEEILLGDGEVDCVVSTWTLCTIPDVEAALGEVRRVLGKGGLFHFLEHGRSSDLHVARWQDRLTPVQKRLGGGCHLNRPISGLIASAGFELERCETFYMKGPRPFTFLYVGIAR